MGKRKSYDNVSLAEQIKPVFKERFTQMLGSTEEYEKFEKCILKPQRKSFRINLMKENKPKELAGKLKEKGLSLTSVLWCDNAYFVEYDEEKRYDLGNLFEHFLGKIYVQEATSMTPPELLDIPKKIGSDFIVLDMAAAPGSKTTQIADKMKNCGTLIANELDYKRIGPLKINIERSGFTNIVINNSDGLRIDGSEIFDRILLDAPCSGSGVIRKSPKTIRMYNPKKLKGVSNLQLKLLQRAYELLKEGGIVVYSTCSLEPEENEFLIERFLEKNSDAKLLKANLKGLKLNNKLKEFDGHKISKEITDKTIRIWPHNNDTNGFYVAKIKKPKGTFEED